MDTSRNTGERPVVVRGALLMFGLVILATTFNQWRVQPEDAPPPPFVIYLLPVLLAASLVVQFFAKKRSSPLLLVSLGLIVITLGLLWLASQGYL